ncbi:MAG: hypothetical protein WAQ52_13715 [Terriglobales bacterium]
MEFGDSLRDLPIDALTDTGEKLRYGHLEDDLKGKRRPKRRKPTPLFIPGKLRTVFSAQQERDLTLREA